MKMRFRIRTQGGQELSFGSREMFEDFVRAGDLSPDDLVYDGETASWSPARTHPIVLEIEYANEHARTGADTPPAPSPEPSADDAFGLSLAPPSKPSGAKSPAGTDAVSESGDATGGLPADTFGLALVPQQQLSPEEATRAFVEKLTAERETEREFGRAESFGGVRMEMPGARADLVAEPAVRASAVRDMPFERFPMSQPPVRAGRRGARKMAGIVVVVAGVAGGVAGGVALAGRAVDEGPAAPPSDASREAIPVEPRPGAPPAAREPAIPSTEAAVRERAQERFLSATRAELRDLPPIPDAWPRADYLTLPSAHPEVAGVFQAYLDVVRALRAEDEGRYRAAYEAALEDAGMGGDDAVARLEFAMLDFAGTAEERSAHYGRVERLASAAIGSHQALLDVEGLLVPGAPTDAANPSAIGAGVAGRDADSQFLLEDVAALLGEALDGGGAGARTPENVRAWIWDGLLDAVTR